MLIHLLTKELKLRKSKDYREKLRTKTNGGRRKFTETSRVPGLFYDRERKDVAKPRSSTVRTRSLSRSGSPAKDPRVISRGGSPIRGRSPTKKADIYYPAADRSPIRRKLIKHEKNSTTETYSYTSSRKLNDHAKPELSSRNSVRKPESRVDDRDSRARKDEIARIQAEMAEMYERVKRLSNMN